MRYLSFLVFTVLTGQSAFGAGLPMRFETNAGQAAPEVKFVSHGNGYSFYFTSSEAVMQVGAAVLRMKLAGGSVEGIDELPGKTNYLQSSDSRGWKTNISAYSRVRYADVYPGIDLVYYGNAGQLEYDFNVKPGAAARSIAMNIEGAGLMRIDKSGELVLLAKGNSIRLKKPIAYQEEDGIRTEVPVQYVRRSGHRIGFKLGAYDPGAPLVIDPVLSFASFLGGTGVDVANAVAVDPAGNMYLTGTTTSLDFPTSNILSPNSPTTSLCTPTRFSGQCALIFITKITADGSAIAYSSYVGGGQDSAGGIAVDAAGNAYVTGRSSPSVVPVVAPIMNQGTGFVLKLNPSGSALIYSTFFGGNAPNANNTPTGIGVDAAGEAYVAGTTSYVDFPLINPIPGSNCAAGAPFVTKFNAAGSSLLFSTCLPAPSNSAARALAVDPAGNAYVTGQQETGGSAGIDAFAAKLSSSGTLIYQTKLAGSQQDIGFGIAADSAGNAYVTGITSSMDFPLVNALQSSYAEAFVAKLSTTGSIVYSTYLGTGNDFGAAIAVDAGGNAYVAGQTPEHNFPLVNPIQSGLAGDQDAFVAELNASGTALLFSTYLGGSVTERVHGITLDLAGNIYVAGSTTSADFPVVRPFQAGYRGPGTRPNDSGGDAFIAKIGDAPIVPAPLILSFSPNTGALGSQFNTTVTGQNLANPVVLRFSGSGVTGTAQAGSGQNTLLLTVTIAPDAALGARSLTIGTATGSVTMADALFVQSVPVPVTAPLPIPEVETGAIRTGYLVISPSVPGLYPVSALTYGMVSGGAVQSQAAILPAAPVTDSTLQVDILSSIGRNLGVAIANASSTSALVTMTLRNEDGIVIGSPAGVVLNPHQQIARFVTELFPASTVGTAFRGSLNVQSSVAVSLVGLRFSGLEFSTLPVVSNVPDSGGFTGVFPQFAMSGGWATALGLVNPLDSTLTGRIDILDTNGGPIAVKLNGLTQSSFTYSIPPRGTFTLAPRDANNQSPF